MLNQNIEQPKKKSRRWVWIFLGSLLFGVFVFCSIQPDKRLECMLALLLLIGVGSFILSTLIGLFVTLIRLFVRPKKGKKRKRNLIKSSEGVKEAISLSGNLRICQSGAILGTISSFLAIPFFFIALRISLNLLGLAFITNVILINELGKMREILEEKEITQEAGISQKPYEKFQRQSEKLRMYRKLSVLGMVSSFLAIPFLFIAWQIGIILLLLTFIVNAILVDKFKKMRKILEEKKITQNVRISSNPYLSLPGTENNLIREINIWSFVILFVTLLFFALIIIMRGLH